MRLHLILAAVLTCHGASTVLAQTITQTAVIGKSGDPRFPVLVRGDNGETYDCMDKVEVSMAGQPLRRCKAHGETVDEALFTTGTGIVGGGAVAGGVLVAVALAAASDDGVNATTTTAD